MTVAEAVKAFDEVNDEIPSGSDDENLSENDDLLKVRNNFDFVAENHVEDDESSSDNEPSPCEPKRKKKPEM